MQISVGSESYLKNPSREKPKAWTLTGLLSTSVKTRENMFTSSISQFTSLAEYLCAPGDAVWLRFLPGPGQLVAVRWAPKGDYQ